MSELFNEVIITGIGSLPHTDPEAATDLIFRSLPQAPHWPQLPQVDFREQMLVQCVEGLPAAVVDKQNKRVFFDTSGDFLPAIEEFYNKYLEFEESGNPSAFVISPDYAVGFNAFLKRLNALPRQLPYIKGQIPGPFSFGLGLTDENRKGIYYHESFVDIVVKGMALKGAWMAEALKPYGKQTIIFVDEPVLAGFGSSALVTISRAEVIGKFNEVIDIIHRTGALVGSHCCGNTDWSLFTESHLDILSFDAYHYAETITLYHEQIKRFLERGGLLAWGIVPTEPGIDSETLPSLLTRLNQGIKALAARGIPEPLICKKAIITPSCGTGTLSIAQAEKVYQLLSKMV